ncbi:GntR family transcriptional regulator [Marinobacter sp. OP 3.4]|uniref:GntR family transcriptional regulator n=1 Tax=Marinobacter sp. OP 3.4 TaxID=3076501 RepID=UPI002E1EAE46
MNDVALEGRSNLTKTVPQQIADQIARRIVDGEFKDGDPLREQELASYYGVSRGPIRDAIQELERRGLLEILPRRGAYVIEPTIDTIADVFNVQAAMAGLAARYMARCGTPEAIGHLAEVVGELETLAEQQDVEPIVFVTPCWRLLSIVAANCGNEHLRRMMRDLFKHSLWGVLWGSQPLDYLTRERRHQMALNSRALLEAISTGQDERAEWLLREIVFASRDEGMRIIRKLRGQDVDPSRIMHDSNPG